MTYSLIHKGMIHPLSVVYTRAEDMRVGDSVVSTNGDNRATVLKIVSIKPIYDGNTFLFRFDDGTGWEVRYSMFLRTPPQNPRYVNSQ